MKKLFVLSAGLLLSTGCAVAPQRLDYSLIDPKNVDMARYGQDYNECAGLANQTDVGERAGQGAAFGAILGAIVGAAICGRNCAGQGAALYGTAGAAGGAAGGVREQQRALRICLAGRGYTVIR